MLNTIWEDCTLKVIGNLDDQITNVVHVWYISDVVFLVNVKDVHTRNADVFASNLATVEIPFVLWRIVRFIWNSGLCGICSELCFVLFNIKSWIEDDIVNGCVLLAVYCIVLNYLSNAIFHQGVDNDLITRSKCHILILLIEYQPLGLLKLRILNSDLHKRLVITDKIKTSVNVAWVKDVQ